MPELPQHNETFVQKRKKTVLSILRELDDNDVAPEQKNAIALRQDLLFGFKTDLDCYEDCRDVLHNASAAACIFCGTMITSFVEHELRLGPAQLAACEGVFTHAAEDLLHREDLIETEHMTSEAETLSHLGNCVEAIEYVARQLYYQELL